ncbi:MAG: (d)CMP kinase [Lachnospiraceae bacterium]|nr:(d)CMP kinase [Lachnospiraceae bacterium]
MGFNIAIDGPAGAGKSTIAKRVAKELGYIYVDTGAMYRAMALAVLRRGIPAAEEQAVAEAVEHMEVSIAYEGGEQQILLNQENVTGLIRTEEVGNTASLTSAYPAVRAKLLRLQQELAKKADVIMDGRDIGTCVLPDAPLKIYLTASVETRGKRRFDELTARGVACDLTAICRDIQERDRRDMSRETAPLKKAEDAVLVDSSDMTIEEVTAAIVSCARERQRP